MAAAADPILASTLWTSARRSFHYNSTSPEPEPSARTAVNTEHERPAKRRKLATAHPTLGRALDGGLEYGAVTCLSAETSSTGAEGLTLSLLVSHLLASNEQHYDSSTAPTSVRSEAKAPPVLAKSTATVIDTTLAFPIARLHHLLLLATRKRAPASTSAQGTGANDDGEAQAKADAMQALSRVKLMKCFDFVGLTECLAEVRADLELGSSPRDTVDQVARRRAPPKGTISDSEASDDEEILDAPSPPSARQPTRQAPTEQPRPQRRPHESCGLLIINTLTQPFAPLLKNNHAQAQDLLASLMRSLVHSTRMHGLCTLVLNSANSYSQAKDEAPSIFTDCVLRPALGKAFTSLLDTHLLVHSIPRSAADARAIYGEAEGKVRGKQKQGAEVEMVNVMEVLQDRHDGKVGRWAAFAVDDDGRMKDVA